MDKNEALKIIESLNLNERKAFVNLNCKSFEELMEKTSLDRISLLRALQFLFNKNLVVLKTEKKKQVVLGENGILYRKKELPERRFLNVLVKDKKLGFVEIKEKANLSDNEFSISLGVLKKKNFIEISSENNKRLIELKASMEKVTSKFPEEIFLESLPANYEDVRAEGKAILKSLLSRKEIVEIEEVPNINFSATNKAGEIKKTLGPEINKVLSMKLLESLTPEILKQGSWKNKKFRIYDVKSPVPKIICGKRQFYSSFLKEVKEKLISLGFEEMGGKLIVSEFWNFDALFQPQFHAARNWADTYRIKNKFKIKPDRKNKKILNSVKKVHELKWRYKWSLDKAKLLIARPQTTVVSAQTLAKKPQLPKKYFCFGRNFRPDIVDSTHLSEFNQLEGIIVAEKLTFKHLLGILKMFAKKIAGIKDDKNIRFLPDYYPFTEPSVELDVKHPKMGWIELGGAGIFREEVVKPLFGKDISVLAWGIGVDRLAMSKLGVTDIRELFTQNLKLLRDAEV